MAFTLLALAPVVAHAQIALVKTSSCGPVAFPTSACSISSTGAGNLIVVGIQMRGGAASTVIATVTDDAGNNYAEAVGTLATDGASGSVSDIWYAMNSKPGAKVLAITPSSTVSNAAAVVWEFSGANTTAPLDTTAGQNSQPATTTPQGAAVTTTYSNEVVVSLASVSGSILGIVTGSLFTNDSTVNNDGWSHLIAVLPNTYSAQWNQSSSATFASSTASFRAANAKATYSACDLNKDGAVNVIDVQLATNMNIGLQTCTANIAGPGVCSSLVVQQVRAAALPPNVCTVASSHSVLLSWGASSTPGVRYNVYRSSSSSSPYTKLTSSTPIAGLAYIDSTISAGQIYYYQVTAINDTGESLPTSPTAAAVPFP
jgi:hypothetical protein